MMRLLLNLKAFEEYNDTTKEAVSIYDVLKKT